MYIGFSRLTNASISCRWQPDFIATEELNGDAATFPLTLEGGVARQFIVRIPVLIMPEIVKLIDDIHSKTENPRPFTLNDLQSILRRRNIDWLGDPVKRAERSFGSVTRSEPGTLPVIGIWELETGRGKKFSVALEGKY